ncbi:uncharacterized protein BJX67DRAFT_359028 [Aspergillus lucknowensis]|uniref:Uncharacterized protein n=1 Tax=Aspergillus lucknowensis TaxID=176173 RepID=A0ABR4LL87_9EURO
MVTDGISCKSCPTLSILLWKPGNNWRGCRAKPEQLLVKSQGRSPDIIPEDIQVYIILASAKKIRACHRCQHSLTDAFCMPTSWWSEYLKNSNGYFGCEATRESGSYTGFNTWAFFETKIVDNDAHYRWSKINIFTRWLCATGQTGVLVFDSDDFSPPLISAKDLGTAQWNDPFWIYIHIMEDIARLNDLAVWAIRNNVRSIETQQRPLGKPQPDYRRLHDIARHAVHVTEAVDVCLQTLGHILKQHECYVCPSHTNICDKKVTQEVWQDVHTRLEFFQTYIGSLHYRSISNEKRLQNEIQLAFNTVSQHDAAVTVEISRAARSDSAAMKTLAFVALTFLPPTFLCAVFSMSFFNYSADSDWQVSGKIWIYWIFAIPTTIATALLWLFWSKIFP